MYANAILVSVKTMPKGKGTYGATVGRPKKKKKRGKKKKTI
jgi:hypothetical protein